MTAQLEPAPHPAIHSLTRPADASGKGRVAPRVPRRPAPPGDPSSLACPGHLQPAYDHDGVRLYHADVMTALRELPADSVDCCITSPPYWGLRDYGLAPTAWGGDLGCDHKWLGDRCQACGALLDILGLESSLDLYVHHLVEVFHAVRRVLKPTGTLWLNLGDCYNAGTEAPRSGSPRHHGYWRTAGTMGDRRVRANGFKTKDLLGIPWRVALALQADGWYLRSDIVWAKPNPLPEAVVDRPARAHEYVFLLTKSDRYYYDAEAVREPSVDGVPGGRARRSVWTIPTQRCPDAHFATFPERLVEPCVLAGSSAGGCCSGCGAPYARRVRVEYRNPGRRTTNGPRSLLRRHDTAGFRVRLARDARTVGWSARCSCRDKRVPAVVLDPFAGSGTTLLVAKRHGRHAVGIELNREYVGIVQRRLERRTREAAC